MGERHSQLLLYFIIMRKKNRLFGNKLLLSNNSPDCKRKLKLNDVEQNNMLIQVSSLSKKRIPQKKCITDIGITPSLASLKIKTPTFLPSPKIFSEIFFTKFCGIDNSENSLNKQIKEVKQISSSPRSIKQCLQEKIKQNVKRHNKKQRLPCLKSPQIRVQDDQNKSCNEQDENFMIWAKIQRQQLMRIGMNQTLQNPKTCRFKHRVKQLKFVRKNKQKYSFFRDFTPWAQRKSKEILLQDQL